MKEEKLFKNIYNKPYSAPWTYKQIPKEIKEIKKLIPKNSKILEIGCGEGNHAIFLANEGFEITAIDSSKNAIKFAKNKINKKIKIKFLNQEFSMISKYKNKFDFIFDWRFLHEIKNKNDRKKYIQFIHNALKEDGKYLTVSFSGDSNFMGTGNIRTSPAGIKIYFATLKETEELIKTKFKIIKSSHIIVPQKPKLKIKANYILAQKL